MGDLLLLMEKLIEGTQNIFFAELSAQGTNRFFIGTSRFMSGRFITMMFGLPGAALALYYTAKRDERIKVLVF